MRSNRSPLMRAIRPEQRKGPRSPAFQRLACFRPTARTTPLRGACVTRLRVAAARRVPGRHRRLAECHRRCSAGAHWNWCSTTRRGGRRHARQHQKHGHQRKLDHRPLVSLLAVLDGGSLPIPLLVEERTAVYANPRSWARVASPAADLQQGAPLAERSQATPRSALKTKAPVSGGFRVAGAGFEPATSGL
jgi:hypothetical protein